jgi:hypothetical protein
VAFVFVPCLETFHVLPVAGDAHSLAESGQASGVVRLHGCGICATCSQVAAGVGVLLLWDMSFGYLLSAHNSMLWCARGEQQGLLSSRGVHVFVCFAFGWLGAYGKLRSHVEVLSGCARAHVALAELALSVSRPIWARPEGHALIADATRTAVGILNRLALHSAEQEKAAAVSGSAGCFQQGRCGRSCRQLWDMPTASVQGCLSSAILSVLAQHTSRWCPGCWVATGSVLVWCVPYSTAVALCALRP